ncbi:MAG: SCO family protein [Sulfurifustis sp.]
MTDVSRRTWLATAGLAAAGGTMSRASSEDRKEDGARAPRRMLSPREAIQRRNFPNVTLVTHEGEEVRFYDDLIKDKFVTLNMMYTGCKAACPLTTANLVRVQKLLADRVGRDLFMYSITLDPAHDDPEVLKEYAQTFGVGKGWKFLTGKPDDIQFLRRRLGFAWSDKKLDAQKEFHTGNLRYGNEPHMLWAAVPAMANPEWVKKCILFADWPTKSASA